MEAFPQSMESRRFNSFPDNMKIPRTKVVHRVFEDGLFFYIVHFTGACDFYNGYVRFPRRFLREPDVLGIVAMVPVHGGVTFAEENEEDGTMVYGFDTVRESDMLPGSCRTKSGFRKFDWLMGQLRMMANGLRCVKTFEKAYLQSRGRDKALVARNYQMHMLQEFGYRATAYPNTFLELLSIRAESYGSELLNTASICRCDHSAEYVLEMHLTNNGICEACEKLIDLYSHPGAVADVAEEKIDKDDGSD